MAWDTAVRHGCGEQLWLTPARNREATHPLDAIPIHERHAYAQIETKKNHGYRAAADHLARVAKLATAAGEPQRFFALLGGGCPTGAQGAGRPAPA